MLDISVVIPAYNEEKLISNTVQSIKQWMPSKYQYEIIVIDHGSLDKTASLAAAAGAVVIDGKEAKSISKLRNLGVSHSSGETLFFIDADITFSQEWADHIVAVVDELLKNPNMICGSFPKVPDSAGLLIKSWFNPKTLEVSPNYIVSSHLITSKSLFTKINGFPEDMETSEEFTLCLNARAAGATIKAFPELIVTHHGAPKSLKHFIKSEMWHGRGDWSSISAVMSSKVALLTLVYVFLHVLLLSSLVVCAAYVPMIVGAIFLLCAFSSFIKFFKYGVQYFVVNIATFYFYFFGRSLSLISAFTAEKFKRRSRAH